MPAALQTAMHALRSRLAAEWQRLRPAMRWALVSSVIASALALIFPQAEEPATAEPPANQGVAWPDAAAAPSASAPTGMQWRRLIAGKGAPEEPAEADPFAPPHAVVPAAPPLPAVVAPPAPPPVQQIATPAPRYRVAGWLDAGDGRHWLLSDGQHELVAKPGAALLDGYVVQAIEPKAIRLQHTATQTQTLLPLPATATADAPSSS